ncbi:MAG: hypothetical protein AAFM91_14120 [Pseudomonadota bacterium]
MDRRLVLIIVFVTCALIILLASPFGQGSLPYDLSADNPSNAGVEVAGAEVNTTGTLETRQADIRIALEKSCANFTSSDSPVIELPTDVYEGVDDPEAWFRELVSKMSVSSEPEHLYFAALIEDDPSSRLQLLKRAIQGNPNDALVVWGAVQACSEFDASPTCPLSEWEPMLIAVDGQNSETWIRIAANRYGSGELDAALSALRRAGSVAKSNDYWPEMIEMIERGLAASTDRSFSWRAGMAFGLAAANLPRVGDYTRMCRDQSQLSAEWAYACVDYGKRAEEHGKSMMTVDIGQAIQKYALQALGESALAAEVERRSRARSQQASDAVSDGNELLIIATPALFHAYLDAVRLHGETSARLRFNAEIAQTLRDGELKNCNE